MWLIAVVACSPLFLTFLFRVAVTGAWKTFGRKLGTKLATPGVFDAFVCRQFRVDGHLNRSGVTLKTYEGETHDNPNPGGGLLGRIWERFMGGRIAYSLRIVVRPEDGIIPSDLTISRLRQPDGNVVRPSEWESTVKVTGDDFGLLDKETRTLVQRLVAIEGAEVKSGAVVIELRGPVFRATPVLDLVAKLVELSTALSMSVGMWQQLLTSSNVPSSPGVGGAATTRGETPTAPLRGVRLDQLADFVTEAQQHVANGTVPHTPEGGETAVTAASRLRALHASGRLFLSDDERRQRRQSAPVSRLPPEL